MKIKAEYYRSNGRLVNKSYDMVRLTIDLPRIEGMKLKKRLEKEYANEEG